MYIYSAYQLIIASDIPLQALVPSQGEPDVLLTLGTHRSLEGLKSDGGDHFVGEVEGVGAFAVVQGRKIIVDPVAGVEDALLNTFLIGPIFAVLLRQRGLLVLHASSVAIEDRAIAFIGHSGAGKSTIAQAFHRHGYTVLTDDVMVAQLQGNCPLVLPGYPLIKLWPESATATGYAPDSLPCIHGFSTKRSHQLTSGFGQDAFPLQCIYVLEQGDMHRIVNLNASDACLALLRHSRATTLLTHPDFRIKNFRQCSWIAQNISMARFERKPALSELSALIKLVEADLRSQAAPLCV